MEKIKVFLKEIGLPKMILIFVAGLLILVLSVPGIFGAKKSEDKKTSDNNTEVVQKDTNTTSYDTNTYISEMENKLKSILSKVSGIGDVEVMITLKASSEQVPLKDNSSTQESVNEEDREGGSRTNSNVTREDSTVFYTDENGNTTPYIILELEPEVEGVLVIAEGGDNAIVKRDIMHAVEVLFNVGAHKVEVMKMNKGIN